VIAPTLVWQLHASPTAGSLITTVPIRAVDATGRIDDSSSIATVAISLVRVATLPAPIPAANAHADLRDLARAAHPAPIAAVTFRCQPITATDDTEELPVTFAKSLPIVAPCSR
jgi:hypothetical protein